MTPSAAEMRAFLDEAKALHARGVELNRPWTGVSHLVLAELETVVRRVSEAVDSMAEVQG